MSLILLIETSEKICSVALCNDQGLIAVREIEADKSHASMLTVIIEELFKESNYNYASLKAVAVSKGPGSYTGLRIGVSVAKGICFALNIPLIALNTLEFLRFGVLGTKDFDDFKKKNSHFIFCSMIDARRMEVYRSFQNESGVLVDDIVAEEITSLSYQSLLENQPILFIGSGADKCLNVIEHQNAFFIPGIRPLASQMVELANVRFESKKFENIAYFEPFYLKDFVAIVSKKTIISF